jgi:hypothetical protein
MQVETVFKSLLSLKNYLRVESSFFRLEIARLALFEFSVNFRHSSKARYPNRFCCYLGVFYVTAWFK